MALLRKIDDWNYGNDPANNQVDRVRKLVGDTDPNRKLISDSEIEYNISVSGSDHEAAYRTALDIQAWAASHVNTRGRDHGEDLSDVFKQYGELAQRLLIQAPFALPRAPQLRRDDRNRMKEDSELIQPQFSVGMLSEDADAIRPNSNTVTPDEAFGD